jgi:hypothetical protein
MPGPWPGSEQPSPAWQAVVAFPTQQRCAEPPQGWQVFGIPAAPAVQASPVVQELVPPRKPQQGCPLPPQATHIPIVQRAPEAEQKPKLPPQQGWVRAPQGIPIRWQEPFMHIPAAVPPPQA